MKRILFSLLWLQFFQLSAQKLEQRLDYRFNPTDYAGRYYAITEKEGNLWHRQVYFVPEASMAAEGWYKDQDCTMADSILNTYHVTKFLKSQGAFSNGKKEGVWLQYSEKGILIDSANYRDDHLLGVRLTWDEEGMMIDSSNFDGKGNGSQVNWYSDGNVQSAGFWVSDTTKVNRWNYFHRNGQKMATEDYKNGKIIKRSCFTEDGQVIDSAQCIDAEASFPGKEKGWMNFIVHQLDGNVPVKKKAPAGVYTVYVQFIVDKTGQVQEIKAKTKFGFGMEEEVIRMLKRSPKWTPAKQFGRYVNAYRIQPVTFQVTEG